MIPNNGDLDILRQPEYEIYINGSKVENVKLINISLNAGLNPDTATIEFPINIFGEISPYKSGDSIIIYFDRDHYPNSIFSGQLREPENDLHPSKTVWICSNDLTDLNNIPLMAWFNRYNSQVYSQVNLTGYNAGDMIEEALYKSETSLQWTKDTFPTDTMGETKSEGKQVGSFIRDVLWQCEDNLTHRILYLAGGEQKLEFWKFGSANNPNIRLIPGKKNRNWKDSEGGAANIASGSIRYDYSEVTNHLYGLGAKKRIETTIKLIPAWNPDLENDLIGTNGNFTLKTTKKDLYKNVFQRWALPAWDVYDSETGATPDDWQLRQIYPTVVKELLYDSLYPAKPTKCYLWVNNTGLNNLYGHITYDTKDLSWVTQGFKFIQNTAGQDVYIELDDELAFCQNQTTGKIYYIHELGDVYLTATFEVPERLWVNTGKQGHLDFERIEFINDSRYRYIVTGTQGITANPGAYILSGAIIPAYDLGGDLSGYEMISSELINDGELFRQGLINKLTRTMNEIKKFESVNMKRIFQSLRIGDYDINTGLNVISITHDFIKFETVISLSNG